MEHKHKPYEVDQTGYFTESNLGRLRPFAVSEVIFDGPQEEKKRAEIQKKNANPKESGYINQLEAPKSGNQSVFEAIRKADNTRLKAEPLSKKPRGYSDAGWAVMQMKMRKKQPGGRT
jgi:hypothetical protein